MKKIILIPAVIALSAIASVSAGAQVNSGYFVENYTYRHQLNPAFASSRGYFTLPAIGNLGLTTQSNVGISTFLYPYNGQLTTFMNGAVSADEFLGRLHKNNKLGVDLSMPFFSVGFWGRKGGFTTVEMNIRTNADVNLPYDLFDFMKNAGAKQSYNISNLGASLSAYTEISLGHAHKITDRLNVGAKVKFLLGIASMKANIDNMEVNMTADRWSINANGSMDVSVPMLTFPTKGETGASTDPSQNNEIDFNAIGDSFEFNTAGEMFSSLFRGLGYGVALDLGATYEFDSGLLEGLNLSASVLDLGFISWGNTTSAVTSNDPWVFEGFDDLSLDSGSDNSLNDQLNSLTDDLADMVKFERTSEGKGKTNMLACTINIGAEYEMPFYRKLSVGFLSSTRIKGPYSHSEGRFSVNIEPVKWFGLSTSYGISSFGSSWGAIANISLPGIGLFIGTDTIPTKLAKTGGLSVPLNKMNLNLNFGLVFNISKVKHLGDK